MLALDKQTVDIGHGDLPSKSNGKAITGSPPKLTPEDPTGVPGQDTASTAGKVPETAAQGTATEETPTEQVPDLGYEHRFIDTLEEIITQADSTAHKWLAKHYAPDPLGRLVNLSRKLAELDSPTGLYRQAFFAARLVARGSLPAAATVLDDIDFSTSKNSPTYVVMRGVMRSLVGLFILFVALVAGTLLFFLAAGTTGAFVQLQEALASTIHFVVQRLLVSPLFLAILFGVFGSVVSIILRLSEFERAPRRSRHFLLMTGMLLPIVGALFAIISCAFFHLGIVNVPFATGHAGGGENPYFFIVIGFLSGFSERFTRGLLGSLENTVLASHIKQQTVADSSGVKNTFTKTQEVLQSKT